MTDKEMAIDFLTLVTSNNVRDAFKKYVDKNFIHHNPFFRGDSESLLSAMEEDAAKNPNKLFEIRHAVHEGDTVTIHSHIRMIQGDSGFAAAHIFRFKDDFIVELWDIVQRVPENYPNENGMF